MSKKNKALILVNVGTPDEPNIKSVRRFLSQFLNDLRVIDLPWIFQKILVNLIIIPFRAKNSTQLYKKLWTDKGSPISIYINSLTNKLQKKTGAEGFNIYPAMRYGNPSLKKVLEKIHKDMPEEVIVFPLFPQYASSTTGSVNEFVMKQIKKWNNFPALRFTGQFYNHPSFIKIFSENINRYHPETFDHIIFSYHGLPIRQIDKTHPNIKEQHCSCTTSMPDHGRYCYKAACYETTRLLAKACKLTQGSYSVGFQSRLSRNWLKPFMDEKLKSFAKEGKKKILVVAPSFVADCLETTVEIGIDYKKIFKEAGGEELVMVESLNDDDNWVEAILEILE